MFFCSRAQRLCFRWERADREGERVWFFFGCFLALQFSPFVFPVCFGYDAARGIGQAVRLILYGRVAL